MTIHLKDLPSAEVGLEVLQGRIAGGVVADKFFDEAQEDAVPHGEELGVVDLAEGESGGASRWACR